MGHQTGIPLFFLHMRLSHTIIYLIDSTNMSSVHLFNIETMKSKFQDIIQIQYEILNKRSVLTAKLGELKILYSELVKKHTKKIFLFCLDSFYFQYKTLVVEMDSLNRHISMMNNRVYGDYYKLYHIIITQTAAANINVDAITSQFQKYTPYRDLEPFHEYKMEDTIQLHSDILRMINHLYAHHLSKERDILTYSEKVSSGISVGNFMQTLCYENTLFREQILLYVNYISFFHNTHITRSTKLLQRINSFYNEIEEDILNSGKTNLTSHNDNENMMALHRYMETNSIQRKEFITNTINSITDESRPAENDLNIKVEVKSGQTPETMLRMSTEFTRETSAVAYVSLQNTKPALDIIEDIPTQPLANYKLALVHPDRPAQIGQVQEVAQEVKTEVVQEVKTEVVQEITLEIIDESTTISEA